MDIIVMHRPTEKVSLKIKQEHIDAMKKYADNVHWFETEEELLASGADAEVIFCWGGTGTPPETWCCQSKRLKWLNTFSAGVDPLVKSKIADLPITVTNAKGVQGRPMALTTMGYCIAHLRGFEQLRNQQKEHVFKKVVGQEAVGKTLGIVGVGAIGKHVAKFAKFLGFKVIGVDVFTDPVENVDEMYPTSDLDKALAIMDFVVILIPFTEKTRHLINADRFAAMKKGAYFINIARGGVVDTDALVSALQSGHLSGCAIDAIEPDALPPGHPLWDIPNVTLSSHCSATSPFTVDIAVEQFCDNIENFKSGKPMFNVVDLKSM